MAAVRRSFARTIWAATWATPGGSLASCAARLIAPGGSKRDRFAWVGLVVSVAFPLAMGKVPELRGALQRAMFAVSFVFVAREFKSSLAWLLIHLTFLLTRRLARIKQQPT